MNLKKLVIIVVVLTIIAGLVGCTANTTSSTTVTGTVTRSIPPAGGVLHMYGTDPYTLDPAQAADMNSHSYITLLFDGLVRLDADLNVVPDIAQYWDISSDRLTYTFHLRDDVYFDNGKNVTAQDFKYSWERACQPLTGSPVAQTYLGDIVGVKDMLAGAASSISGVSVPDDRTLEVKIEQPITYFISKLTYPTSFVVDQETVEGSSTWWQTDPNGTGPFKLSDWQYQSSLVLDRNTNYHGQIASLERVEYTLWSGIPVNMYEDGDIDIANIGVAYIDRANDPEGSFAGQLHETPELSFSWIGFNTTTEPFDDIHVRRAFTMALDKDKIISVMFRNLVEKAGGILPSGIPGYNENLQGLAFDVQAAQEELAASRYGGPQGLPDITLTTSGYGGLVSAYLEAAVTQWRENLGVDVTIRVLDPDYYLYNLKAEKDEMFDIGWVADYPHPQDFLDILFHSGAENNFAEYSNKEVDTLLDQAGIAVDESTSLELYQQAEQLLIDDAACLPLWFGQNYYLVKQYVEGYELNGMGLAALNEVSITK